MLARLAHEVGLRFSENDLFDAARRYADFVLVAGGHGARASNVTYGRVGRWPVRAFDFRYEVGHGTRRSSRFYGVAVVETDMPMPPLLMWNNADADMAPLAARTAARQDETWAVRGSDKVFRAAQAVLSRVEGLSCQTCGYSVMLMAPVSSERSDYLGILQLAPEAVEAVETALKG